MVQSWTFTALLAVGLLWSAPAPAVDVVVHAAQPDSAVSRSLVRGIFGMRVRAWPDGAPLHVFVLDDAQPLHQEFCKSVLQMYPYQLRQNWDRLLYSGTGQPPVVVASEEELLQRVAQTPGSIGYVTALRTVPAPDPQPKSGSKSRSRSKSKSEPNSKQPPPAPAAPVKVLNVY